MPSTSRAAAAFLPPSLSALLPATQQTLRQWARRQTHRHPAGAAADPKQPPLFPYQDLPPSANLSYELVRWTNVLAYLPLFGTDPSPFVDARFKHRAPLEAYAVQLLTEASHSWKRGACDWLVRRRRDNQPLGVLHLYDLSHENTNGQPPNCAVGYALAAPFRQQGHGFEALSHLLRQAATLFGRTEARALFAANNLASQALLAKCGFTLLEELPAHPGQEATHLWQRKLA